MKLRRKLFSESENKKEIEKKIDKENDPEYLIDRALVGGTTTALIGGTAILGEKYLRNVRGIPATKVVTMLGRSGKLLVPAGLALTAAAGYKKYKNKKKKNKKDESKA